MNQPKVPPRLARQNADVPGCAPARVGILHVSAQNGDQGCLRQYGIGKCFLSLLYPAGSRFALDRLFLCRLKYGFRPSVHPLTLGGFCHV